MFKQILSSLIIGSGNLHQIQSVTEKRQKGLGGFFDIIFSPIVKYLVIEKPKQVFCFLKFLT